MTHAGKIAIGILIALLVFAGGTWYATWSREQLLFKPQMYPYVYYGQSKKPASVLIIESLSYRDTYVQYYDKLFLGKEDMVINGPMPIIGLSTSEFVYVKGYTDDSVLAEVVCLSTPTARRFGKSYKEGWVYARALHASPPPVITNLSHDSVSIP